MTKGLTGHRVQTHPPIVLSLPTGWSEWPNSGGPREFRTVADDSQGVLQLSRIEWPFGADNLCELAEEFARRLGWGSKLRTLGIAIARGPSALVVSDGGEFPSMLLCVTLLNDDAALLWTWLGPDPLSDVVGEAIEIVSG